MPDTVRVIHARSVAALFGLAAALAGAMPAQAQDKWPSKSITVIVPFAAGGNADVLGRIFADKLSQRLGQSVVIENRAGAGGNTGVAATAKAAPDGYTIGVGTASALAINPHL